MNASHIANAFTLYATLKTVKLRKILLIIQLTFIANVSCGQELKLPIFKDTFSIRSERKKVSSMQMSERAVQYLGPYKDTIRLQSISNLGSAIGDNKVLIEGSDKNDFAYFTNGKLKVIFDPLNRTTLEEYEWWTKNKEYKYYKAFPIIISNESDSITIVGYGYNIPIILEALDKDKVWKPVEMRYIYDCGVGLEYILLKPNEILCVLAPIYKGNFKTKLRYRLGNSMSPEFTGKISAKQFDFKGKYR